MGKTNKRTMIVHLNKYGNKSPNLRLIVFVNHPLIAVKIFLTIFLFIALGFGLRTGFAQVHLERFGTTLYGEQIISVIAFPHTEGYAATPTVLYGNDNLATHPFTKRWETPYGTTIFQAVKKLGENKIIILLNSGESYEYDLATSKTIFRGKFSAPAKEALVKITPTGNSILTKNLLFRSDDNGATWNLDTNGLNNDHAIRPLDISNDTDGNIYLATQRGVLFRQKGSGAFLQINNSASGVVSHIFVDRKNRIIISVGNYPYLHMSLDSAKTWTADTTHYIISSFADDASGNLYGLSAFNPGIYRRSDNGIWMAIESGIVSMIGAINPGYSSISVDSLLIVGARNGAFLSDAQVAPWKRINDGILTEQYTGLVKTLSGILFASNGIGILSQKASDAPWDRTYPTDGDYPQIPLFGSTTKIFIQLRVGIKPFNVLPFLESSDEGKHWTADTLGLSAVTSSQTKVVDNDGGIHFLASPLDTTKPSIVWTYPSQSGSWFADTIGFPNVHDRYIGSMALGNDGWYYASLKSGKPRLIKRFTTLSQWIEDPANIPGDTSYLTGIIAGHGSDLFGINGGLVWRSNNIWKMIAAPPSIPATANVSAVSYDSSGRLFVSYYLGTRGYGIFMSTNFGDTWTTVGLDSMVAFRMHSYGDTTYALMSGRGAYSMISNYKEAVTISPVSSATEILHITANPSSSSTEFYYDLPTESYISLSIYDALGRQMSSLLTNQLQNGKQSVSWNTKDVPYGEYYYKFTLNPAGGKELMETGKIIVVK
jgi:hypothetical protein